MDGPSGTGPGEDALAAVYAWVVAERRPADGDLPRMAADLGHSEAECRRAVAILEERHVLIRDGGTVAAASPDVAIAALVGPRESAHRQAESELLAERDRTDRLRARLAALAPVYSTLVREGGSPGVDVIEDMHAVRALISDLTATCESEIMACQPGGGRPPRALADALPRDLALLRRGIVLRSLYQHTARFHVPTQDYAEAVLAEGSQIRTVAEIPGQMIIVDQRTAFLPHVHHEFGAIVVREPSILAYLCAAFEQSWNLGTPFQTGPSAARMAVTEIKSSILTLMANGLKDDVIAKRMGLSVRACRGHIAELMETFGARSRFQAGVIAAGLGLLDAKGVDGTPETGAEL
ncbi:DNA-binding CsgD family transcriptional regulator/DNA-binding Lrp family transcriptional regulator [Catenulispora sp. EB89]|uniref:helix-turn-helix transcriptional regulator n=1 Tax=Catenulispora sp. EB89 TaxID=3156257 RepID=UPI0035178652